MSSETRLIALSWVSSFHSQDRNAQWWSCLEASEWSFSCILPWMMGMDILLERITFYIGTGTLWGGRMLGGFLFILPTGDFGTQGLLTCPWPSLNSAEGAQILVHPWQGFLSWFVSLIPREKYFAFYSPLSSWQRKIQVSFCMFLLRQESWLTLFRKFFSRKSGKLPGWLVKFQCWVDMNMIPNHPNVVTAIWKTLL